jgi:tetratricopeptide (TPR) repeat protein
LCGDIRESGFPEREVTLLRVAADRYPRHVWIHFDLMRACMKRPDLKVEAIRYGAAAAAAKPDNALVQYNLGIALANSGGLDAATVAFQRAILVAPKYASIYIDLGGVREKKGDIAGAMAAYEGAIKAKPSNATAANAHYRLGSLHLLDKNFDEATRSLQTAVQLAPGNATYIKQLDSALNQKKKSQKQE